MLSQRLFSIAIASVFSLEASAQDTLRFNLTSTWKVTDIEDSIRFTRKAWKSGSLWQVRDSYYPSGALQMTGTFSDDSLRIGMGEFTYYHSNGQVTSRGRYAGGKMEGEWLGWFFDGAKNFILNYKADEYHGTQRWFHYTGKVSEEAVYENGEAISVKYWTASGKVQDDGSDAQTPAAFPAQGTVRFLSEKLVYPPKARRQGIEGRTIVQFVVNLDGTLSEEKVVKSSGNELLDAEALRVVRLMPRWQPAMDHNRAIRTIFRQAITFKLT